MSQKMQSNSKYQEVYQQVLFAFDYKEAYRQIRNYLAGRLVGSTRDEVFLKEVIKCLFCKIYIQKHSSISSNEATGQDVFQLYKNTFKKISQLIPELFLSDHDFILDWASVEYIDQMLDSADLENPERDPFGDVYEVFIGSQKRGQEGQFFTPQNAVELLVSLVNPLPEEKIIDPACGAGGFLSVAARHLTLQGASPGDIKNWIFGIDKDSYLVSLAAARLSLVTLEKSQVFCADSLAWNHEIDSDGLKNKMGEFDIVLANPPFGSRIVSASPKVQGSFELGYKWRLNSRNQQFQKLPELQASVPPQVLFIERCLALVRPGGRIGIVVPESLISSKTYRYVVNYIQTHAHIKAVIGMPESLFKISGKGGTHTKTCLLFLQKKADIPVSQEDGSQIFMAEAKWCGHDSRGRQINRDELPLIANQYCEYQKSNLGKYSHLGYSINVDQIVDHILAPRYYNPEVNSQLLLLQDTHDLVNLGGLIAEGLIEVKSGDEVGKLAYGMGTIPFIRTSDISNWEIKVDPKHCVSEEIYKSLATKQDVQKGDILMVRDGTYLIGTCAFVTEYDTRIVYQSHLYKLRVKDNCPISPYLILAALSSAPVQQQIKSKRFTQDIIDSLGNRIQELILPIPKEQSLREEITQMVKQAIHKRIEARELSRNACIQLVGTKTDLIDCNSEPGALL